ncbi:MAG: ABC transporter permease subunit [Verrucomicrobiota bacterium]
MANPKLLPEPFKVVGALWSLFSERDFATDVGHSLVRISVSFLLALLIALPLGMLMGTFPFAEGMLNPLVSPFRYLPAASFVPLLLMWLGPGDQQKITLLILGVIWFLITAFMDDTKQVRQDLIETAQTLGAKRMNVVSHVVFRAALPSHLDTTRQLLAVSWTYLVIAEIVAATTGIGAMMMRAKRFVRVDEILAGIVTIAILGLLLDLILRWIRWGCFPWARSTTRF